jgi:transcriptional regulator with XRE-family HTH domain
MDSIGVQLRAARQRLKLTLREVEERASQLAQQWGNAPYRISASWLDRVERENRGLSATKLIVLAFIYQLTMEQMLALCPGVSESPTQLELATSPSAILLLAQGSLAEHGKIWLPDKLVTEPPPEDTRLLPPDQGVLMTHFRRGIIGRRDCTMEPMILAGSIVLIDTKRRTIAKRKEWTNEFDRPIYFLLTRTGYFCGFCELDRKSEYLKLVPHALSTQTLDEEDRRWKYRKQVDVIGTVTAVLMRRATSTW